ncbi:polyketide cyclase / dehydrase and lipid transport [Mycobacterium sp. ACS1612]|uniref:type II toxin-antitoxin system Rv0910 family toxin n=1 Tax=Mycobacterium sp. ACS1612 TaxID=1834117 RepID=UPI0007FE0A15|nr:SRPBCC family protein [Mycobacterium sp. ACS1612]OBF34834.1 polyketide cyclase / dehydrase and lipid transport [Mycobacterium sp. ACS1612]
MAKVDVAVSSSLSPEKAWALASDLRRFDEWLTIFNGWRSEVPSQLEVGTCVSSCIRVKGVRNIIHWRVTRYDEPELIEMVGRGRPGIRIGLCVHVVDDDPGTTFRVVADLSGGVLNTPVGNFVAKLIRNDVRKSVENLAALG